MLASLISAALAQSVFLLASGDTGGVGSGTYRLADELDALGASEVVSYHGALVYQRQILIAKDGTARAAAAFIESPTACEETGSAGIELSLHSVAVRRGIEGDETVSVWDCGEVEWMGEGAPPASFEGFEHRLALRATTPDGVVEIIGRPANDFARRVREMRGLAGKLPDALVVDAGNFVDGASSVRDGSLSLHRPTAFEVLRDLRPTALAPGRKELAGGPTEFFQEKDDLPYVAANWTSETWKLPTHVVVERDGAKVAVVGLVDPSMALEDVELSDPSEALAQVVSELDVDVVIALFSGSAAELRRIQAVPGVHVVVGDPGPSLASLSSVHAEFQRPYGDESAAAWTLPVSGVTVARLNLEDGLLDSLDYEATAITPDLDPDPAVTERIAAVRHEVYPSLDATLLPVPPGGPMETYAPEEWQKLVCEAAREAGSGDVAFLPTLPGPPPTPGPLTAKLVLDQLAVLDAVEVHEIGGDLLQRVLDKAFEVVPIACGAVPGAKAALVDGRPIDPIRTYRLVTTDRFMADATLGAIVAEGRSAYVLDQPTVYALDAISGAPLSLRNAVREVLRESPDPLGLLARSEAEKAPLWLLRMTRLSLSAARFQGVEQPAYEAVPETLATSPSSLTLLADLDSALEYSDRSVLWDFRQRVAYTQLLTEDDLQEPADDVRLSSSLTLPGVVVPVGLKWSPYSELLLDSELTAVEEEDGTLNPQQADASLTVGLSAAKTGPLSLLRVGGFGLRDLSVPEKPTEFGGRLEAAFYVGLGPQMAWTTTLDSFVFASTPEEDASDLRFKALADTRLPLGLARWLAVAPYAQVFAFAGRVPETEAPAASFTLGASLDLAGAFAL